MRVRVRARAACDTCQENKIGMRWRTQKEVFSGKGQFACGNIACDSRDDLSSYEVHPPPPPPSIRLCCSLVVYCCR